MPKCNKPLLGIDKEEWCIKGKAELVADVRGLYPHSRDISIGCNVHSSDDARVFEKSIRPVPLIRVLQVDKEGAHRIAVSAVAEGNDGLVK